MLLQEQQSSIVPCGLLWSKQEAIQSSVLRFTPLPPHPPAPTHPALFFELVFLTNKGMVKNFKGRRRINRFRSFWCAGLPTPPPPPPPILSPLPRRQTHDHWLRLQRPLISRCAEAGRAASPIVIQTFLKTTGKHQSLYKSRK